MITASITTISNKIKYFNTKNINLNVKKFNLISPSTRLFKAILNEINLRSLNAAALAPSCAVGCVTQWKKYDDDSNLLIDGVSAGLYDSSLESFIGRVRVANGFLPGRVQINQPGLHYVYSGIERYTNESVEFLYKNSNYSYEWMQSENGTYVENAVTINVPRSSAQYIGRIEIDGRNFIGTVVRILGGMFYADSYGIEKFTTRYEVLVCKKQPESTTEAPTPLCPIYWKSFSSQTTSTTPAPQSFPMIINAQNGMLIGDGLLVYSWANLANFTANLIKNVAPASLIMPGQLEYFVGRVFRDGIMIIGTVDLNTGIMQYSDGYGNIQNVLCFEVLVCNTGYEYGTTTTRDGYGSSTTPLEYSESTTSYDGSGTTPNDGSGTTPNDGSGTTPNTDSETTTTNNNSEITESTTPNDGSGTTSNTSSESTTSSKGSETTPSDGSATTPNDGSGTTPRDNSGSSTTPHEHTDSTTPNDGSGTTPNDGTGTTPNISSESTTPHENLESTTPNDGSATATYTSSESTTSNDGSNTTPSDNSGSTTPSDGSGTTPNDGLGTTPNNGSESTTPRNDSGSSTTSHEFTESTTSNDGSATTTYTSSENTTPSDGSGTTPHGGLNTTTSDNSGSTTPSDGSGTTSNDGSGTTPYNGSESTTPRNDSGSSTTSHEHTESTTPNDGSATSTYTSSENTTPSDGSGTTPNDGTETTPNTSSESTTPRNDSESSTTSHEHTESTISNNGPETTPNGGSGTTPSDNSVTTTESTTIQETSTEDIRNEPTTTPNSTESTTDRPSSHSSEVTTPPFLTTLESTTGTTTIPSESSVTNSTTASTSTTSWSHESSTTTTRTTTKAPSGTCSVTWRNYNGHEDLSVLGVDAGVDGSSPGYVGQASVYGNLLPGRIELINSDYYCYIFGVEDCIRDFEYLETVGSNSYEWVPSQNGDFVEYAIPVRSFFIGRIWANGSLYLGTVVPGYGMVYHEDALNTWQYSNNSYEVLTCNTAKDIPHYDCDNKWKPYHNDIEPLNDGIYTDDANTTFVGRMTENNNYVVGRVQIIPPTGLHYLTNSGAWNIENANSEYLVRSPVGNYQWVDSSFGEPVEHAVSIRKSSSTWPSYIGRVQINSTYYYVGKVLPSRGIEFYDGNPTESIISHYQVLICSSAVPPDCGCGNKKLLG